MEYTFEQIPNILKRIENRLDKIEKTLLNQTKRESQKFDYVGAKEACKILNLSLPTL